MQINKIHATNMEMTAAIKSYAEEKFLGLAKLTVNYEPVASLDIEVGKTSEHHQKGNIFKCEATMLIPGDVLRVEVTADDLYAAIDKCKDRLKERLAEHKDTLIERRQME
ncbi:MAG: ribosome-associated translation inhibitor RaiA [Patescibacteria group bacterium]